MSDARPAQGTRARRCVVVRGGWPGHDPVESTDAIMPFLRERGFDVSVHDSADVYADRTVMEVTDLVVQNITNGTITDAQSRGLRAAVEAGTGLVGWHAGLIGAFRGQLDYLQMVGAQFVAHPQAPQLDDAPAAWRDYVVRATPAGREHPVTAGLEDFQVRTEQYWVLSDGLNHVLQEAVLTREPREAWESEVTMPVTWTRHWGRGRIVTTTLGHEAALRERAEVRGVIERALEWASR